MINASDATALALRLAAAGVDINAHARTGGAVWCFGSRAAGCASDRSDWDILLIGGGAYFEARRTRHLDLDIVEVHLAEVERWEATELASHVVQYGVRLDEGRPLLITPSLPLAAARKCSLVSQRAVELARLWSVLKPSQQLVESLRLRRDVHRAWLLTRGSAIPPTAVLDAHWRASSPATRMTITNCINVAPDVARAMQGVEGQG